MRVFLLTGKWYKARIAIVVAKDYQDAVRLVDKEDILCPWMFSAVELWSAELKEEQEPKIIGLYKPDEVTANEVLAIASQRG